LVIDVSSVADIKDLDNPLVVINGVYDPEPFGFEGFEFGEFILQIIACIRFVPKFV
jgi:hypothetical protein